jgi:hypothetical protein
MCALAVGWVDFDEKMTLNRSTPGMFLNVKVP